MVSTLCVKQKTNYIMRKPAGNGWFFFVRELFVNFSKKRFTTPPSSFSSLAAPLLRFNCLHLLKRKTKMALTTSYNNPTALDIARQ